MDLPLFEYHKKLKAHFSSRKKTWAWFAEDTVREKKIEEIKDHLLKNTYRLSPDDNAEVYEIAWDAREKLGITAEVILYQENNPTDTNASIYVIDKEAHIVFSGKVLEILSADELKALIAHELTHYLFYKTEGGEYEVSSRIIVALGNDHRSDDSLIETSRIFSLYLELYCDRGALLVVDDPDVVIRSLIKMHTGLKEVSAQTYIEQAKEIILHNTDNTTAHTHPDNYIRSLAIHYYEEKNEEKFPLRKLIEGNLNMVRLDIFRQREVEKLTQDLIQIILKPFWIRTGSTLNLAQQYFSDFTPEQDTAEWTELAEKIEEAHTTVKDYLAYILMDFAFVDSALENIPLGHVLEIAELSGISENLTKLIRKEFRYTTKDFRSKQQEAVSALTGIRESEEESLYKD